MSTSVGDFHVNDPVHVSRTGGGHLEGVVAYIGNVQFADGDDWVGIRLTGPSAGQGKNDGTVQNHQYFNCPENCGMFVRTSAVTKRTLSKLEELRLRRELQQTQVAAPSSTTPSASRSTSGISTPSRTHAAATTASGIPSASATKTPQPPSASVTSPLQTPSQSVGAGTTTAANKLEELRKRRAMLKEKRQDVTDPVEGSTSVQTLPSTEATAPVSPIRATENAANDEELKELRQQISSSNEKLHEKEEEIASLNEKLSQSQKENDASKSKITELQNAVQEASKTLKESEASRSTMSPSKLAASYQLPEDIQEQIMALESKNVDLDDKLEEALNDITNLRRELDQERKTRLSAEDEISKARAEATSYHNQLQAAIDQSTARGQSDATHYKERAKLLAEISNYKRKIEQLEKEKTELEVTVEDITLDKEQLQEEKEALEDRFEELKLDAETAQMDVEELKMELEDARATTERLIQQQGAGAGSTRSTATAESIGTEENNTDAGQQPQEAAEMAQALQVQNARLREALIRLREQAALEKMEITRQLRSTEKNAHNATELQNEINRMTDMIANMEEQISDLKDMVEQGAAFEGMVEDLSDRVLSLEEDNVMLHGVVREMEEAAELTAEMEEVQAEEIKALTADLESRNVIVRNLEEAIKMQRRREDDFRRTVGNYKTTVETLKQEKKALLELQEGGEGEKSDLIASSQKALAKAAQLVADAAEMRKREAQAAMQSIDCQIYMHLGSRLEHLLPHNVSELSREVGAIKGELLGAKVVGKASKSLEGIEASFIKIIRPALPHDEDCEEQGSSEIKLSDEARQQVATMIHQAEFASVLVNVSADVLRLLVAGQWPDLLTPDLSTELGNILGHTLPDLDNMIQIILKSLKEEGSLTVEQSNIGALTLTVQNTMQALRSNIEREDQTIVSPTWNPLGWHLLKAASLAKFSCQGAAAALCSAVNQSYATNSVPASHATLYNKVEQTSSQASNACSRLANLDLKNDKLLNTLNEMIDELECESSKLLKAVQSMLLSGGSIDASSAAADSTLRIMAKLLAALRGANMSVSEQAGTYHRLSPEVSDAWYGISSMSQKIRSIDGDVDDINYLIRAHKIESHLRDAVENEPKLIIANQKVSNLEKTLSSRSKEIAMQNARLSELEKIVAKSSSAAVSGRGKAADLKSSEEYNILKEENRVLTEAMDVLQREVEMYETEIRALKDKNTPMKRGGTASRATPSRFTPRPVTELSPHPVRGLAGDDSHGNTGVLEATLFRPALQQALREASRWKAASMSSSILDLPPLPPIKSPLTSEEVKESDDNSFYMDDYIRLSSAINNCRMVKASVTMVDLTNRQKAPRAQLQEMKAITNAATESLETEMLRCRGRMMT